MPHILTSSQSEPKISHPKHDYDFFEDFVSQRNVTNFSTRHSIVRTGCLDEKENWRSLGYTWYYSKSVCSTSIIILTVLFILTILHD